MNLRLAFLLGLVVLLAAGGARLTFLRRETRTPVDLPRVAYATSQRCVTCHPARYATWHRTFHRTMTQVADSTAVVGDFANATYTYAGVTSRFTRENGRSFITTLGPDGSEERDEIVMTVGSRRIQQYVTVRGGRHVRLPLAWDLEEKRWIHLNGGFLDPDGIDFNAHTAEWDANCIFCHNVKAQPRWNESTQSFDAHVAELGIACEACHGPAAEHVARNTDPLRRYLLYATGRDPSLRSPAAMSRMQSLQVCGHCHGQRVPNPRERLAEFLVVGDPYTAGEDLARFTTPIDAHTEIPGVDLTTRFWSDGTPRLTAYEYQGVLTSAGHERSNLTCISCHDMHGGDPRGMIHPAMRGSAACLQCHAAIGRDVSRHTHHAAASTGSDCVACHMPSMTYGILSIHPSHRITSPDPARAWRAHMPDACTLCHADRSATWAARAAAEQYGHPVPADLPKDAAFATAECVRALFAGDAVERAVAADALTRDSSYTDAPAERLWTVPFLLLAMEDRYPAVRRFAWRGLERRVATGGAVMPEIADASRLPAFDYLGDAPVRRAVLAAWWGWWRAVDKSRLPRPNADVPLDAAWMPIDARIAPLRAAQKNETVAIGE